MRLAITLSLFALCALAACKPAPGGSCDRGEAKCVDKQSQLVCQKGSYIQAPCKGPRGCGLTPTGVSCDITGNQPGDICSTDEEGASGCIDAKTKIVCSGGKFAATTCRGPRGCETQEGRPLCDLSVAEPGDACREADLTKACSVDGKQYLSCRAGKMTMEFQCLGPNGCKSEAGKLSCDMSYARDQDPCTTEMEGKHACNLDKGSIVMCKGGKFVVDEECKSGTACNAEGSIRCEKPEKKG
ncbi:MAG: DUF1962 domain-containing protein [Myxococcales bacterium]|nr:DUF1962 domain-containing protein [Myxococcales bacterium]